MLILLLLFAMFGSFWLAATENGLHWAYRQASLYIPGELIFGNMEGRLIGPITISQLDYQFENTEVSAERVILDWSVLSLLSARIDITRLYVQALNIIQQPSSEPQQDFELPQIYLPWQLSLHDVVIDDVRIRQAQQVVQLNQLRLEASSLFNLLSIEMLNIKGDRFGMDLNGSLTLNENYPHNLQVSWHGELPTKVRLQGEGTLEGNMDALKVRQTLSGPLDLKVQGELKNLLKKPSWKAKIDASRINTKKLGLDPSIPAVKGKLKLQASGDLDTVAVTGEIDAQQAELGAFTASYKFKYLKGNLIKIDALKVHTPATKTSLNIKGDWKLPLNGHSASGDLALKLDWKNLRWPLQDEAWFSSASGAAQITGNSNQYSLDLTTDRPWPQAPPSKWHLIANGNQQGMDIQQLSIQTLDGNITSKGKLEWSEQPSWEASTTVSGINPGLQWSDWPGALDATIISKGHVENGSIVADAHIEKLQGLLRDNPLELDGKLHWQQNELTLQQLNLISGSSSLKVSGQAGDLLSLDWSINSDNLTNWMPQAKGALQAKGRLTGSREQPDVQASFKGQNLSMTEVSIGSLDGTLAADLYRWNEVQIQLTSKSLSFRDYSLQSLDIVADSRSMQANVISPLLSAQLELKGGVVDNIWKGQLEKVNVQSAKFNDWKLLNPVGVSLGQSSVHIEELCLNSQQAKACANLKGADLMGEQQLWESRLTVSQFSLEQLKPWIPPEFSFEGTVDANTSLRFIAPDNLTGQSKITFSEGKLNYQLEDGEFDSLDYRHATIDLSLTPRGLQANAGITMVNDDHLLADLTLADLNLLALDPQKQALKAQLTLNIKDYSILETLLPEVRDVNGNMQLQLSAAGTIGQPRLSGNVHLQGGTALIPRLGLSIDQITLQGKSDQFEQFNFDLSARSGEGLLSVKGQTLLDKKEGWPTTLKITGNSVEVSRIPEARVLVSPDLQVNIKQRNIDISGNVHIPFARLEPKDITTATRVSDDVVIVGSEQPPEDKWAITSKVRVILGDRVKFYGFGFEGRFEGSLLVEETPGQPTRATGDINVPEGRYKAYGQNLEIEQGRLLFTGGPVVNPGLDIRAIRRVNEVTAGLRAKGTLNQPQIELFTIPAMGQTDALSYLLLGRPIENASNDEGSMMAKAALALSLSGGDRVARSLADRFGLDEMRVESNNSGDQASLVIGRYLSPKLYVSYGVGLIDSFNTFNIRYQLSEQWQLKGESGENQGADLLYTIER